jgi:hypothetical protein
MVFENQQGVDSWSGDVGCADGAQLWPDEQL